MDTLEKNLNLYGDFTASQVFKGLVEKIPNFAVKAAILEYGIGDSLEKNEGKFAYDYESGELINSVIQDILCDMDDEKDENGWSEWDENYGAICAIAEAYAEWANMEWSTRGDR